MIISPVRDSTRFPFVPRPPAQSPRAPRLAARARPTPAPDAPAAEPPRRRPAGRARAVEDFAFAVLAHGAAAATLHARLAARLGLTPGDFQALDLIARRGPLTAGELGRRTGLASASVTGLVDRLKGRQFVRRTRDAADARRVHVEARPDGFRRIGEALAALGIDVRALSTAYTVAQLDALTAALDRVIADLHAALEPDDPAERPGR